MSKRVTRVVEPVNGYQPRLVIRADGVGDVYRVGRALERDANPRVAALGRRILESMDEQEPGTVRELVALLGPASLEGRVRGRRRRPVQLRIGMTEEELRQAEEAVR